MAAEYRAIFGSDVVVDLIGYRRHGHSEVDDPTITQPLLYEKIKSHPPLWKIYAERTGLDATATLETVRAEYETEQTKAGQLKKIPHLRQLPKYWSAFHRGAFKPEYEVKTGLSLEKLAEITDGLVRVPEGFHTHPKIVKLLEQRARWGMASAQWTMDLPRRSRSVRYCRKNAAAIDRAGFAARNVQPAACGADRYGK